jgi:hypothetical protein
MEGSGSATMALTRNCTKRIGAIAKFYPEEESGSGPEDAGVMIVTIGSLHDALEAPS